MRITLKLSADETDTLFANYKMTEERATALEGKCRFLMTDRSIESVLVVDCDDKSICLWN